MMELLYFLLISVLGSLGIIVVSKVFLNALLRRDENYYDSEDLPAVPSAQGADSGKGGEHE